MTPGQEALVEAMRVEQARIYGRTIPDTCTQYVAPLPGFGQCEPDVLDQLVADLTVAVVVPPCVPAHRRVSVEQAIARGEDDDTIAAALTLPLAAVRDLRDDLDRLAS